MIFTLTFNTSGQGLVEITQDINQALGERGLVDGLCSLLIQHTSASLLVQENADPSAQHDLENWLNRLVPENDPLYTHIYEGPDDITAHLKAMLTNSQLSIPMQQGRLCLGTWQGVFLWEHRYGKHQRRVVLHVTTD